MRPCFRFYRPLLKDLCRIAHGCLTEYLRIALDRPGGAPAAVMVMHSFGEYLVDFHPHPHALVADGLFDSDGAFHPAPDEMVLWPLADMFRRRVIGFLLERRLLPPERARILLSWSHSGFGVHRSRMSARQGANFVALSPRKSRERGLLGARRVLKIAWNPTETCPGSETVP